MPKKQRTLKKHYYKKANKTKKGGYVLTNSRTRTTIRTRTGTK
jgi:hypothetical protein